MAALATTAAGDDPIAPARARLRDHPTSELALAVSLAYASLALRATVRGELHALQDACRRVGRAPTDVAVALLMGRHPRLGAHSPLLRVPGFLMRYILSILGAPFDLLNDRLTVSKFRGSVSIGFCGVTWRRRSINPQRHHDTHCDVWLPNAQGPCRIQDSGAVGGVVRSMFPRPPPDDESWDPEDSLQAQIFGGEAGSGGTIHEYRRNKRHWKECCAAALGVTDNLATRITHGDTLLHVACRIVNCSSEHEAVARWLAARACRLVRNAHGELPHKVVDFLPPKSTLMTTGVSIPCGDHKSFPSTGAYAACADLLADPVDRPVGSLGWVHDVTVLLGKPLPPDTTSFELCACKRVDGGGDDGEGEGENPPTFVVTAISTCHGLVPHPAFQENRGYLLTDEQTLRVTPPLRVPGGSHLALVNRRGSLNITCALGATKRHRVVATSLPELGTICVGATLQCGGEKKACCGWRCCVEPI